ncbi:MAG: PEP-CTERM sorting domain-containing protein [Chthoniobacterales bacterium]
MESRHPLSPAAVGPGTYQLTVGATGGFGGSSASGVGGRGGDGTASGTLTNSGSGITFVNVSAIGAGSNGIGGAYGAARSDATAIGGSSGSATSSATVSSPGSAPPQLITSENGFGLAPVSGVAGATSHAQTRAAVAQPAPAASAASGLQAAAFVTGSPLVSDSLAALSAHPNVHQNFNVAGEGSGPVSDVFGLAVLGGSYSSAGTASETFSARVSMSLNLTQLPSHNPQDLVVGLLDPHSTGTGFDLLTFTIMRNNAALLTQSFTSLTAANSFFHDHTIDFGAVGNGVPAGSTLDLQFQLDVTAHDPSQGFSLDMIFGNATLDFGIAAVPEPASAYLLLAAGAAFALVRRARSRR